MATTLDKEDIDKLRSLVSEEKEEFLPEKKLPSVRERKYPPVYQKQVVEKKPKPVERKIKNKDSSTFLKIDEHIAIANDLVKGKIDIKQIAATISLLSKAEKIRTEAIVKLEDALNKLVMKLNDIKHKMSVDGYVLIEEDYNFDYNEPIASLTSVANTSSITLKRKTFMA